MPFLSVPFDLDNYKNSYTLTRPLLCNHLPSKSILALVWISIFHVLLHSFHMLALPTGLPFVLKSTKPNLFASVNIWSKQGKSRVFLATLCVWKLVDGLLPICLSNEDSRFTSTDPSFKGSDCPFQPSNFVKVKQKVHKGRSLEPKVMEVVADPMVGVDEKES